MTEERAQETRDIVDQFGRVVGRAVRLRAGWKAQRRVSADGYEFVNAGLASPAAAVEAVAKVVRRGALYLDNAPEAPSEADL